MEEAIVEAAEPIAIANEFSIAIVRKVRLAEGEMLEIQSPKLGYVVRLDAMQLETLTLQPVETFSAFLATPYGPVE